jgi:hypothetical protein
MSVYKVNPSVINNRCYQMVCFSKKYALTPFESSSIVGVAVVMVK